MREQSMDREAHNGVKRAFDSAHADRADPFLNSVSAGLVEGLVALDVMVDR